MAVIQWDSRYSVDVRQIDRQHRKIIDILNGIYSLQNVEKDAKELQKVFDKLRGYILRHFKAEEAYLAERGCEEIELQRSEHEAFIEKVCSFQQDFLKRKPLTIINLFNYVWDWFAHHILTVDKKCVNSIREKEA